jgi:hypothetical protein
MAAYNFLLKVHNLFLGLKLFNENDITHFEELLVAFFLG